MWCGVMLSGGVWCTLVWCGALWRGVVHSGGVWCTLVWVLHLSWDPYNLDNGKELNGPETELGAIFMSH